MKKFLLTLAVATATMAVNANDIAPIAFEGEALSSVSPSGQWVCGQIADGSVVIHNLETGEVWPYLSDGITLNYYVGLGNAVSNTGVVIGATKTDNACYWENGKWYELRVPNPQFISNTGSITPDGNVICGGVGRANFGIDADDLMLAPAVWYRQDNGTYGNAVLLPHPDLDYTGRVPQYITAICISDDGKTVAGQIRDFTGYMHEPIVYQCDDEGNWTYKLLARELLNPNNVQFPEWPGELPDDVLMPSQEWYMTPEQIAAFVEANNKWYEDGMPDGKMPTYEQFMTPEQIAEYRAAMKEFQEIYIPWQANFDNFMEAYMEYAGTGTSFLFNNVRMSPDGKYYVSTADYLLDPSRPASSRYNVSPIVIEIETDDVTYLNPRGTLYVNGVTSDYTVYANSPGGGDTGTYQTYVYPQMSTNPVSLYDYVYDLNPVMGEWMEDNMLHDVIMGLNSSGGFITEEMLCTGVGVATPDQKYILTNNTTYSWFDYNGGAEFMSYLFSPDYLAGVEEIGAAAEYSLKAIGGGMLKVTGSFATVEVYGLAGEKVFSVANPGDAINTGLGNGIYVVRGVDAEGQVHTLKTVF